MLALLADQIYQSPLALLRENTQNAFDAIRLRQAIPNQEFVPRIQISVDSQQVVVSDNGIGMTSAEVETNFWHAGRSSKNTDAARAAGVVGTFGIGAMANFGVADELVVETESAVVCERTRSSANRAELSTSTRSISVTPTGSTGTPGTTISARLASDTRITVQDARNFLREFVEFLDVPVVFNGQNLSGAPYRRLLPSERHSWTKHQKDATFDGLLVGDVQILGMATGELRVVIENARSLASRGAPGTLVLLQDRNVIRTMRSGFGLATIALGSHYQWGGIVDLPFLMPTAGREALDTASTQLLQQLITAIDNLVSPLAAQHSECFGNDGFLRWLLATRQFHLCGPLEVTARPFTQPEPLQSVAKRHGMKFYSGQDESVIRRYASEDEPLVVLSRRTPRRDCELGYLTAHGIREIDTSPRVEKELATEDLSFAHTALATRIERVLEEDYFLGVDIRFGTITDGLPMLVTDTDQPVVIFLNPHSSGIAPLLALHRDDFDAFGPFVKDFIRSTVFSRIADLVPSSTREGSEAFLRHLRANREWFEYELSDKADLKEIFDDVASGRLTIEEARKRLESAEHSFLEVSPAATAPLSSVIREPQGEQPAEYLPDPFSATPGIDRRDEKTTARILTSQTPVNGYHCFLSISDRVQSDKGHFFLQPHSTEVVWGGRKVLFVFQHHSKSFGLYYDILCPGLVGAGSGGGPKTTATILTSNRTFIPIPDEIAEDFVPRGDERKRLEVRCDILYLRDQ
jgi:molecular chaperone HtpG